MELWGDIWHKLSSSITPCLEIITVKMKVNFQLAAKKHVMYRAMVNILVTLKNPCATGSYLKQNLKPIIRSLSALVITALVIIVCLDVAN